MNNKIRRNDGTFSIIWMLLFVFQSLLSDFSPVFSYIDEAPLILFAFLIFAKVVKTGKLSFNRESRKYVTALALFVLVGLAGNVIYRYQPTNLVLIDLITNLKFFGAIAFFSMWMGESTLKARRIPNMAKVLTVVLTVFFLIDRVVNIFPADYRYGIKSAVLFYDHPTYLAGICAFLIAIMTIYGPEKFKPYIFLDLVIMVFTLRSKAVVSAIVYVMLYVIIKKLHAKLKIWQIIVVGIIGVVCAWSQIYFYFINLGGQSARSVMLLTSFLIMKDYFPIGTGFATYASHSAAVNYSPVYSKYGFELIYELRNSTVGTFFDDQFWPIILGQTGVIGTACYIYILFYFFRKIQMQFKLDMNKYMAGLFVYIYLLISSTAEPAFNNSVAIPLAMVIAMVIRRKAKSVG